MEAKQNRKDESVRRLQAVWPFCLTKLKKGLSYVKMGSFGGAILTMLVSVGAYALIAPLQLAVGMVVMVLIHELGHVVAAKQKGLSTSAPVFIPFIGAMVNLERHPRNAATEAYIALGGPLLGSIGAFASYWIGNRWDSLLLLALAYIGFIINLVNLLPIHPLDGGRIAIAVSRRLVSIGLIAGLVIIVYYQLYILFIFWILFALDLARKYIDRKRGPKLRSIEASYELPLTWVEDRLKERGLELPRQDQQKDLEFTTYSELDGHQKMMFLWEDIGLRGTLLLPGQVLVHRARLLQTDIKDKKEGRFLLVRCRADYYAYENEEYFTVPQRTRWALGSVYLTLAVSLIYMLYSFAHVGWMAGLENT
ncbi:Zn-dependent proteases [Chlamydia abortus]|uniref:Site-2 protease family protein n=1 Tax=Paenibacillus residui TaxID=629724 RepID=A0ABW3DID9_9BACL|nr:site-2 protease family protein [Paenibacillus sp. 32O-W]SHE13148.1 Zn-dependent proteases [Chlamydia abortus]